MHMKCYIKWNLSVHRILSNNVDTNRKKIETCRSLSIYVKRHHKKTNSSIIIDVNRIIVESYRFVSKYVSRQTNRIISN